MKLRSQLSITILALILGLLLSSTVLILRSVSLYRIKEFQVDYMEMTGFLLTLTEKSLFLSYKEASPDDISKSWLNTLENTDELIEATMDEQRVRGLNDSVRFLLKSSKETWELLRGGKLLQLEGALRRFLRKDIKATDSEGGFRTLRQELMAQNRLSDLDSVNAIFLTKEDMDHSISAFTLGLRELEPKIDLAVKDYIKKSIIYFSVFTFLIFMVSLYMSFRFSRKLVKRIGEANSQVEEIIEGSMDFQDESKVRDELDILVREYHIFSKKLSDRLGSLQKLLQNIGNAITSKPDMDAFETTILELGQESIHADSALLFLSDENGESLNLVQHFGFFPPPFALSREILQVRKNVENYFETHPVNMQTRFLGDLIKNGEFLFIKDNEKEKRLPHNADSTENQFISSFIALPLTVGRQLIGMLLFCNTSREKLFSDLDFAFMKTFSFYTAQSIDNVYKYESLMENQEIQKEIDIAAGIQKRLLPDSIPAFSIGKARIHSKPARGISGDYFDAIRLDENKVLFTICDVAGKGVPASMLMIMIRTVLHAICMRHKAAHTLLRELNIQIAGKIGMDQYATMTVFILDEQKKEISYSNAAHHPLYLFRSKKRELRSFDTPGLPIGVDKNANFGHKRIKLEDQDYLFLFTDGLPEARNSTGEELSVMTLLRFLSENLDKEPEKMVNLMDNFISRFASGAKQHDDQTFLALKIRYPED